MAILYRILHALATRRTWQTAQNVLERYVKATEEARQSMRSLSDAEQTALQRLQKREMKEHQPDLLPSSAAVESRSL